MKKMTAAKAAITPATAKAAALMPPRLTDVPISALASSISLRTGVDTSVMALLASVPSEGSAGPAVLAASWDVVALWATGGSSLVSAESDAHGGRDDRAA